MFTYCHLVFASLQYSLLHDLRGLSPGLQSLLHVPVSVMETSQVHVGVDVLVVVMLLGRTHSLTDREAHSLKIWTRHFTANNIGFTT